MLKTILPSVYSESLYTSSGMPLLLLDNLRSAFNVGSFFRTAEALHPASVLLTGICCRPGNRKLSHTSRGTYAIVPWRYFSKAVDAAIWAKKSGRMLVAVENSPDALPLWEAEFDLSSAFMFGNEADGLSPALADMADVSIYYPQSGVRTCINVSSIGAVIASEIQRRRCLESNGMST
ncbi:MAG: TrmH family RNA methyltransferase [Candidatus Fermentibacteria bacterium]